MNKHKPVKEYYDKELLVQDIPQFIEFASAYGWGIEIDDYGICLRKYGVTEIIVVRSKWATISRHIFPLVHAWMFVKMMGE